MVGWHHQLNGLVQLFATSQTAACQAALSNTNSRSLLRLMSIKLVMPSNHLILRHPLLLPSIFLSTRAPTPGVRVPPSPAAAFSPPGLTSRPPANPTLSLRRPFSFLNMTQWPVLPPHSPMPTAPSTVLPTPPHPCRPTCRSVLRGLPRSTPHREIGHSLQIHLRHHPECYAHPLCSSSTFQSLVCITPFQK